MKAETPEWKKEIAEKVRAYGERKKRLTTPPGPIKEHPDEEPEFQEIELSATPVFIKPEPETEVEKLEHPVVQPAPREPAPRITPAEPVSHAPIEIWTDDVEGIADLDPDSASQENAATAGPYALRRFVAGLIDHTILVVLWIVFIGGFSIATHESLDAVIKNEWNVTIPVFLLLHFVYYLYFFRATRQTPGMVFLSLELRDPGSAVIPIGKILARWLSMVLLNLFNFIPAFTGKRLLLMDLFSSTEMRSFK